MSETIAKFYNRSGILVYETLTTATRSWVLDAYGQSKFTVPIDSRVKRENIEVGNFVVIESDYPPIWAGIVELPRTWHDGYIEVTAYSPEYILRHRIGPINETLNGVAGTIFETIINKANAKYDTRIRIGQITYAGITRQETLNFTELYGDIKEMASRANYNWNITPAFDQNGYLIFEANIYEKLGEDVSDKFILEEGYNIPSGNVLLTEQGVLANSIGGYGDGADWKSRVSCTKIDQPSIDKYGLREYPKNFSGVTKQITLEQNTTDFLNLYKDIRNTFSLSVYFDSAIALSNPLNNPFLYVKLGNTIGIKTNTCGFNSSGDLGIYDNTRIMGMAYNEDDKVIEITCETREEESQQ